MWIFGKKSSSVKSNNKKKDDVLTEIEGLLTHIEMGKYSKNIDADCIGKIHEKLNKRRDNLECTTLSRNDNIDHVVDKIHKSVENLYDALDSGIGTERAAKDLTEYLDALSNGMSDAITRDELRGTSSKQSSSQSELSDKIKELVAIRARVSARNSKINRDKEALQQEKEELENLLIDEDDADRSNDLDRRISGVEGRIATLSASYSANSAYMSKLAQIIEFTENACAAGGEQAVKANGYLNLGNIRANESDPGSLDIILQRIKTDNEQLIGKTARSDENRSRQTVNNAPTLNAHAQARKEELLNKRRQKEVNDKNMKPINRALEEKKEKTITREVK